MAAIPVHLNQTKMKTIPLLIMLLICTTAKTQQLHTNDTSTVFKVFGVCEMCKERIETTLQLKGIHSATWDIDTKMLTVSYDVSKISFEKINSKIAGAGHDTYYKTAPDAVYNALPKCCRYRGKVQSPHVPVNIVIDSTGSTAAEKTIKGVVLAEDKKGVFTPLQGASVQWLETGEGALTNEQGVFNIPQKGDRLIISYTGYMADTISIIPTEEIKIILGSNSQLKEVKVTSSKASTYINALDVFRTQNITQKELFKAACCNLSESFETNPSVDVSYNDAVTGSKQIQLLGLAGVYTQLTVENLPGPRGLATALGLNSIPGTWIENIQLSKGTGSVANGFESIAGQINVELKKPVNSEKLFANLYVNSFGKTDMNLNLSRQINSKWSTALLLHDDFFYNKKMDINHDGFRDMPTGNLFSGINRWNFDNGKGLMAQFGIKFLDDAKTGGQTSYNADEDKFTTNSYGLEINTRRAEAFAKLGYVFPQQKYKSIGLQLSAFSHEQDAYFGFTTYNGKQNNFYSNLIYQSIINSTIHKFRTGLSFLYDDYNERFNNTSYKRTEVVPGAFFEYTYTPSTKFDVVAGIRQDHNSLFGWFTTPRLNVRYQPFTNTIVRVSAGRGQRTANIFAENTGVFASARMVEITSAVQGGAYGLKPEVAWNKGITIDQKFRLFNRAASLGVDFFRNDFTNQVVVDIEDARKIRFYNLDGKSYSNSLQAEFAFMPVNHLDVKLAYRWFDVKTTYSSQLLKRPLLAPNRAFVNLAYEVKGWKFDYTISYSSRKRLPSTAANPEEYQFSSHSPAFATMNAQVSKTLGKKSMVDVYIGGENLTNYYQQNSIIAASEPFSEYFDASLIWGPVTGRMLYGGVRVRIK